MSRLKRTYRGPALEEMSRVLDRGPLASPVTYAGDVRVTQPWSHGALHDATRPMREHVVMTYYGATQRITRSVGRELVTAGTRVGTVTIIPAGQAANWNIDGPIEVSHVYVPPSRLQSIAETAEWELLGRVAVEDQTLAHLLAIIARESQAKDAPTRMMVEQALDLVVLQLARVHSARHHVPAPRGRLAAWQLRKVVEHMGTRLGEPLTLDELSALVGLSRYHFCSAFRRSTGMPPHQWLRVRRMAEAKRLLSDSNLPVTQVALCVGYETSSPFARAFKAVVGMSPMVFRRGP